MRPGDGRLDLVGFSQNAKGTYQLDPALDVGAILLQAFGEAFDHRLDGVAIMLRRRDNGRWGRDNDRRALLIDPRERIPDQRQPLRALGSRRPQRTPPLLRLVAAPLLLG